MSGKQIKTINQILTKKIDKWLESIDDEQLRKAAHRDVIVTGGSIASMLLGEEVNDYDLYFKTYETTLAMAHYYLEVFKAGRVAKQGGIEYDMSVQELTDTLSRKRIRIVVKSAGVAGDDQTKDYQYFETGGSDTPEAGEYLEEAYANLPAEGKVDEEAQKQKPDYHPVFLSSNAISLKGGVQVIIRFYGGPEAIHENFDFVHCMNYWTPEEGVVVNNDSPLGPHVEDAGVSRVVVSRVLGVPGEEVHPSRLDDQRGAISQDVLADQQARSGKSRNLGRTAYGC